MQGAPASIGSPVVADEPVVTMEEAIANRLRGLFKQGSSKPITDLYFEAHVTIDPAKDEEWEAGLRYVAGEYGFRVAELLMKKGGERSRLDDFMTTRSTDYDDIVDRTNRLVDALIANGYVVRRWKVENTLLDVRLKP